MRIHPVNASMMVWASSRRTCSGRGWVGEPFVYEVCERVRPAEAYGGLVPVEELFEGVRVAFAPLSRQVACRGVFALLQRGEEFVEVHGGVPFLLRCWLITSIGEDPALVRSCWLKRSPACVRYAGGAQPIKITISLERLIA